jgi:hypothetical protein|tara:strand:- start:617 stop:2680 length:2064 start_codon:yes stop_codon:yes gene_type:complete
MAQSSRYFYLDSDILLEFIYHDQGNPSKYQIEVDDNGSEVKFLDTIKGDASKARHLINELGSAVVNFDVTETLGYLSVENFAARTLLLQNGKTYKFNLSALADASLFNISGSLGIYSYSSVTKIGQFTPTQNGTIEYSYEGLIGGKIIVDTRANPLFANPDENTGNDINQTIGRYHAVQSDATGSKYALLGYDSTGDYEMFNYVNNNVDWLGGNETDLLNSQTNATANINFIKYDSVRLHLRSGFSFAGRGYEGFLFQIAAKRNSGIRNNLTQLVYLNTSNYEYANPKPFILGETLWSKFIDLKIPTLVEQNSEFNDLFYGDGSLGSSDLDITSNYELSFKLIETLQTINGYDYFITTEENKFTVSREDEFQDFTVVLEDATDGDYFKIYGEKDNSIGAFEAYILNQITATSDDIVVMFDVDIFEKVGSAEIKTFQTSYTQYEDFNTPIVFRPVIINSNIASSFSIDVTMRIWNQTDNTQIVKRSSLTVNQAAKYGKRLNKLSINSPNQLTEVYNVLPQMASNKIIEGIFTDNLPKSVKYVPTFIERHNVIASKSTITFETGNENIMTQDITEVDTSDFISEGKLSVYIPPFTSYYKFVIAKRKGDDVEFISFVNAENVILTFGDGKQKLKFNHVSNKDINLGEGEVLFKISEANANTIRGMKNNKFYISVNNGIDENMILSGKFTI